MALPQSKPIRCQAQPEIPCTRSDQNEISQTLNSYLDFDLVIEPAHMFDGAIFSPLA